MTTTIMTPPFKVVHHDNTIGKCWYRIDDSTNLPVADYVRTKELANLIVGLLNGHFNVPVVFNAEPINLTQIPWEMRN